MRYVCKIHVLDVMDHIVVSGYVHGYDGLSAEPPTQDEFSYSVPGVGLSDAYEWLTKALYDTVLQLTQEPQRARDGAPGDGGLHTISESSDTGKRSVG
jgi:hypothetical protein